MFENRLKGFEQSRSRGAQFIAMRNGKRSEKFVGTTRQAKIYFAGIALARRASNPTFGFKSIDELNGRVMPNLQALGQGANGGRRS